MSFFKNTQTEDGKPRLKKSQGIGQRPKNHPEHCFRSQCKPYLQQGGGQKPIQVELKPPTIAQRLSTDSGFGCALMIIAFLLFDKIFCQWLNVCGG